MANTAQNLR
ncbi:hypothetical protein SPV_2564 [Streptococcus pneumoniae]|nr:hypothetical protein SPV_2564 [Streptococcus pneumoniae]